MVLSPAAQAKKTKTQKTIPNQNKINIIFDLDATLINSMSTFTKYGDENPEWFIQSIGPHQHVNIQGPKTPNGQDNNLMYFRPYAPELLQYLAKHPLVNISVWSAGTQKYVEGICKVLFGVDWKKTLKIVISRKDSEPKYTSIISQTGEVFDSDFENRSIKDLDVLFTHKRWGKIFTRKNTLLIDDAFDHYVKNKGQNIVHVPAWDGINSCDTVLWELQQWFKHILAKPPHDITRVPTFEIKSHLGMTTGSQSKACSKISMLLQKIDKNNKVCAPKLINYYKCRDAMRKPDMTFEQRDDMTTKCTQDHMIDMKPFHNSSKHPTKHSSKHSSKKTKNSMKSAVISKGKLTMKRTTKKKQ